MTTEPERAPELSDGELAEIEARAAAATEGPWEADGSEIYDAAGDWVGESLDLDAPDGGETNARFAAAARTDVPRLVAALRAAREERGQERWRATQELERKTASFDKEIAEAVADIERIAAERDEASRLAKDRLTVIGAIREEQARLRHLAADETEQLRGELHQMRDHSAADLETIRNLRAALARAEQATTAARQRVLAICDEMAGGPERGCSGYADEIRDALAADVPAAADEVKP